MPGRLLASAQSPNSQQAVEATGRLLTLKFVRNSVAEDDRCSNHVKGHKTITTLSDINSVVSQQKDSQLITSSGTTLSLGEMGSCWARTTRDRRATLDEARGRRTDRFVV